MDCHNFTHQNDWMKDYRIVLWNDYAWSIAYYFSLKLHKNGDISSEIWRAHRSTGFINSSRVDNPTK